VRPAYRDTSQSVQQASPGRPVATSLRPAYRDTSQSVPKASPGRPVAMSLRPLALTTGIISLDAANT
jgi:hypothetical protein